VVSGLSDAQARQLEPLRQQTAVGLAALVPIAGAGANGGPRNVNDVVLLWTFSIVKQPMAVFDSTRNDIPFPNDALISQSGMNAGMVNLPVVAGDPMAMLNQQLNTLDGFSTTAPESVSVDVLDPLNPTTFTPAMSVLFLNLDDSSKSPQQFAAGPVYVQGNTVYSGKVAVASASALLPDQAHYAVVITNDVTDTSGRTLAPAPVTAMLRFTDPLVVNGKSQVNVLSDQQAAQLEMLRLGLNNPDPSKNLFMNLERVLMVPRNKVSAIWTFPTQSIVRPLNALDEYPSKVNLPTDVTITHTANRAAISSATLPYPSNNLGAAYFGTFTSRAVIDHTADRIVFTRDTPDATARFGVQTPAAMLATPIKFTLTVPLGTVPVSGWPVVVLQHDFTSWRGDMMALADSFAKGGFATIAFDLGFHGARTVCTKDADCASGAAGSCNTMTGVCTGGLKLESVAMSPLACAPAPLSGDPNDCNAVASGAALVNPADLFLTRDNLRQYVVDLAQLVRVLKDTGNTNGLSKQTVAFDSTRLAFLGLGVGGTVGALFLAVAPDPRVAVLNATGGHLFDEFAAGGLKPIVDAFLMQMMVQPDTAAYNQLDATARWILDPADPFAVGQFLIRSPVTSYLSGTANAAKILIQQEPGLDMVIPPPFQQALATELFGPSGLDQNQHVQGKTTTGQVVSTFFATAAHASLIDPTTSPAATAGMQNQAVVWISTSGMSLPSP
jgi:hypothetical protein